MGRTLTIVLGACLSCAGHPPASATQDGARVEPKLPFVRDLVLGRLEDPNTGSWGGKVNVLEDTLLFRAAGSSDAATKLAKCEVVTITGGALWEWPQRVVVTIARRGYAIGDEFFVLSSEEEGYRPVWHHGNFGDYTFLFDDDHPDWLRFGPTGHDQWWFAVVTSDGRKGWSNDPNAFSSREPCRRSK
jgi:hypothetical protein